MWRKSGTSPLDKFVETIFTLKAKIHDHRLTEKNSKRSPLNAKKTSFHNAPPKAKCKMHIRSILIRGIHCQNNRDGILANGELRMEANFWQGQRVLECYQKKEKSGLTPTPRKIVSQMSRATLTRIHCKKTYQYTWRRRKRQPRGKKFIRGFNDPKSTIETWGDWNTNKSININFLYLNLNRMFEKF